METRSELSNLFQLSISLYDVYAAVQVRLADFITAKRVSQRLFDYLLLLNVNQVMDNLSVLNILNVCFIYN